MTREFEHQRVSIMGIGRSGVSAARALQLLGAQVFLSDTKAKDQLQEFVPGLDQMQIPYETDGHSDKVLAADLIVLSPGVPKTIPILAKAGKRGIPLIGEIELAFRIHPTGWLVVTGSNGKSTTTMLVGEILSKRQNVPTCVVGNIGVAASEQLLSFDPDGTVVAELSSFQLETIERFHPQVAAVLNLSPDHMDRYPCLDAYYGAKKRVFTHMTQNDWAILNADDPQLAAWAQELVPQVKVAKFSLCHPQQCGAWLCRGDLVYSLDGQKHTLMPAAKTMLKGPHNIANQLAALLMAKIENVEDRAVEHVFQVFKGLEHRLEWVRTLDEVEYYNDSKATTVESVRYALQSFDRPVHLIVGGYDKGADYSTLLPEIFNHCVEVVLIGATTSKMQKAWKDKVNIHKAKTLEQAVEKARDKAKPHEIVLLSPACASFDMFKNFEDRGQQFKSIVKSL